ncbi:uncharacterized protein isoform X1 [Rhodnius prolixus]|uniref:Uncharacterized protein n=2 Tax=Rhodnius TaxID=13248 RepID=T1HEB3_RHOPR
MPQGIKKNKNPPLPGITKKKKDKVQSLSRKSRPIAPKKVKNAEVQHLKKVITKNVNKCMEEQIRSIANDSQKVHLSKKKDKSGSIDPNKMPPKEIA